MESNEQELVVPGEKIKIDINEQIIFLGPGLIGNSGEGDAIVTHFGKLRRRANNIHWVTSRSKCYMPQKCDLVIGVIYVKRGDLYKVDINGPELASLSVFAFEGATKRQKPNLRPGDVVFARVLLANEGMEPELVCVDSFFKSGILGILPESGFLFRVNQNFACALLRVDDSLLETVGKKMPYEIAIGLNGYIWLHTRTTKHTYFIYNFILCSEKEFVKSGCTLSPELREMLK